MNSEFWLALAEKNIKELRLEIKDLQGQIEDWKDMAEGKQQTIGWQIEKIEKLEKALERALAEKGITGR